MADNLPEIIQLPVSKKQFDLLSGAFLAVASGARGATAISQVTTMMTAMDMRAHVEETKGLAETLTKIHNAILEKEKQPEDCGRPDCPVHGDSPEAQELRKILGIIR